MYTLRLSFLCMEHIHLQISFYSSTVDPILRHPGIALGSSILITIFKDIKNDLCSSISHYYSFCGAIDAKGHECWRMRLAPWATTVIIFPSSLAFSGSIRFFFFNRHSLLNLFRVSLSVIWKFWMEWLHPLDYISESQLCEDYFFNSYAACVSHVDRTPELFILYTRSRKCK